MHVSSRAYPPCTAAYAAIEGLLDIDHERLSRLGEIIQKARYVLKRHYVNICIRVIHLHQRHMNQQQSLVVYERESLTTRRARTKVNLALDDGTRWCLRLLRSSSQVHLSLSLTEEEERLIPIG